MAETSSNKKSTSKTHILKIWPGAFLAIKEGDKRADVRKNDRDYHVGDLLVFSAYSPTENSYLDVAPIAARVTHIQTGFGLPDDIVVMSFHIEE